MIEFEIQKKSEKSAARLGILKTPHGEIETPSLVPVATQAVIKTLEASEVEKTNTQIWISNTFHLHLKPGEKVVKQAGGLHEFSNWKHPIMTDSGGFQVFSLGFGRDHGVGKILKAKSDEIVGLGQQPKNIKITEDGVHFRSPVDGSWLYLSPKESIQIQQDLGADIIFAFDEATSPVADKKYTQASLEKTHRWAKESIDNKTSDQALYGIVQGGKFEDLRRQSAQVIGAMEFDGFGIGGEYGDDKQTMVDMLTLVTQELPEEKPRHLLGIGHPEDFKPVIEAGADTFDCIVPTHYARHGTAFTRQGRLDLKKTELLSDQEPLDSACACSVCGQYKRSYIAHLFRAKEITALKLLTFHNLFYFNELAANLREDIKNGNI